MTERLFILGSEGARRNLLAYLGRVPLEPALDVVVRHHVERRSLQANARLWLLHKLASDVTGYAPEEMHEFALMRHFGHREVTVGGITRTVPLKRSSMRDKREFAEFMEATEAWYIAEFGVWLDQQAA